VPVSLRSSVEPLFIPGEFVAAGVPKWKLLAVLTLVLAAATGTCVAVGYHDPDQGFNWNLAASFGTALGTTLLALATFWVATSTHQDVRASQIIAGLTAEQVRLVQEANRMTNEEQRERLTPAVIGSAAGGSSGGGQGEVNVELINVGGGPAVSVRVEAIYFDRANPLSPDAAVSHIETREIPYIAPGTTFSLPLPFGLAGGTGPPGGIDFTRFRVRGRYFDRRGIEAGAIIDWRQESLASVGD
jgi:hypothetical protein